jgi:hypothetical protein
MQKLLSLVCLFVLFSVYTSCKKSNSGCQTLGTPCPDGARAIGLMVISQGMTAGSYVYDVSIYYVYPGNDSTGKLDFWIGNKQYAEQKPLQHADSTNIGTATFSLSLAVDSFTIKAEGYNTPQRCDCDPTLSYTHF